VGIARIVERAVEFIGEPGMPPTAIAQDTQCEILLPDCNIETVRDGRGGIFTWVPQDTIREFNMLYFQPGKTRGNHFHPEFHEYFLVVEGQGTMVWKRRLEDPDSIIHMGKGMCVRTPSGIAHAFYAITPVTAIAMLTKPWDDSHPPIVHAHLLTPQP
jgi:mannose-6-phosphate isomerase-like protein (cupin superfamily)